MVFAYLWYSFEVAISRKAVLAPRFEYKPRIPFTGTHAKAQEKLQERLLYFRKRREEFRSNRTAIMNKDRQHYGFTVGQIVYMYNPRGSQLQTGSRKVQCHFVGPLQLQMHKSQPIFTYVFGWSTLLHGSGRSQT